MTPNIVATVWDEATWASKSTTDFAAFDVIVFGDQPICFGSPSIWATAVANRGIWSAAVSGNVFINGTDPDFHDKSLFVHQGVTFAAADARSGPGLYVSLSCAYHSDAPQTAELLVPFGSFTVRGVGNCPNLAHKIAEHPALSGIAGGDHSTTQNLFHALAVDLALLDRNLPWLTDRMREISAAVASDAFPTPEAEVENASRVMARFVPDAENRRRLAEEIVNGRRLAQSVAVELTDRDLLNAGPADIARLRSDIVSLQEVLSRISAELGAGAITTFKPPV